jgi:FtsP/CotA-like multicopper oxidase with cupredoxin domain
VCRSSAARKLRCASSSYFGPAHHPSDVDLPGGLRQPEPTAPPSHRIHEAPGWLINGSLPSPLLRVRRGETFDVLLANGVPDPLILHWHGLTPPESADGHPRFAIKTHGVYQYRFTVDNRAGAYWYHSHSHMRIAKHTQLGIAGMILVEDEEEGALGLPSGEREIPLVLQDRQLDASGLPD